MAISGLLAVGLILTPIIISACSSQAEEAPPPPPPPPPSPYPRLRAEEVFRDNRALRYDITITPADLHYLNERGNEEKYVSANLEVRGENFETLNLGEVGFRHKGAWSLHHCWDDNGGVRNYQNECAKLSYKIKFNEYDNDTRFYGLKRLNLHAADNSILPEILANSIFAEAGITAPRFAPAMLYINGELSGLFLAVEQVDGRFTKFRFPETGDGYVFKEVWPKPGQHDGHYIYHLKTNEDDPDVSGIQAWARAIDYTSAATFAEDMEPFIDLDMMLRYIAIDRALKNWDGIMAFYHPLTPHNFFWYLDDAQGSRFIIIPWDLDNTFWECDPIMYPQCFDWITADPVPDWNVFPSSCEPIPVWTHDSETRLTPPGCDKFLQLLASTQWDRFKEIGEEQLAGPLNYETMNARLTYWAAFLEPLVEQDPLMNQGDLSWAVDNYRSILADTPGYLQSHLDQGYRYHGNNLKL
ncbi:CotH kinase family protein [Candidatus Margulisiibacteriota bacterium]